MTGPLTSSNLEIELAVARGREYLVRAVFRAPCVVTIGTSPRSSITLPDASLPEYHELIHLGPSSWLSFESDSQVEMQVGGVIRTAAQLIEQGLAEEGTEGWRLPLEPGSKGLVRFGALRVLVKARACSDATIWSVSQAGGPLCGGCGGALTWALTTGGALSPCQRCGDLNRVEGSVHDIEAGQTSEVPQIPAEGHAASAGRAADDLEDTVSDADVAVPSGDEPAVPGPTTAAPVGPAQPRKGADLPTWDAIAGMKGAQLPTFDAIEARKAAELPPTSDALRVPKLAGKPSAPEREPRAPVHPAPAPPVAAPGKGADLPTFDAIQVVKGGAALSTSAAISVMKGRGGDTTDSEEGIPAPQLPQQIGPPQTQRPGPTPSAGPAVPSDSAPTPPIVPALARQAAPQPPPAPVPQPQAPAAPPKEAPAPPPPPPIQPAAPARSPAPPTAGDDLDDDGQPTPHDLGPLGEVPPTRQIRVHAAAAPGGDPAPSEAAAAPVQDEAGLGKDAASPTGPAEARGADASPTGGEDDFLMGRSDGGIRVQHSLLGWFLVGVGLLAGGAGCLLILVAVLYWRGLI